MSMLSPYTFRFPIILVDGEKEDRRKDREPWQVGDDEPELIIGEAEVPYDDYVVTISDRWMPGEESTERAKKGKFNACLVVFYRSGTFVIPWSKEKFKERIQEFESTLEPEPKLKIKLFKSEEELRNYVKSATEGLVDDDPNTKNEDNEQ